MDRSVEEHRGGRPRAAVDVADEAALRRWASRLCVTPNELLEILEENGDRLPPTWDA